MQRFTKWLANLTGVRKSLSWENILLSMAGEDDAAAFRTFKVKWSEFIREDELRDPPS
jgi:hypothetical protein